MSYRLPIVIDSDWLIDFVIDYDRLLSEAIFVLLQVILMECLSKFVSNGFIQSSRNRSFSLSRSKKINWKPFSGKSQEIVMLLKINKEDSSPSFTKAYALPQTSDIRRNVSLKFTEPSMKTPCWCKQNPWCTTMAVRKYSFNIWNLLWLSRR